VGSLDRPFRQLIPVSNGPIHKGVFPYVCSLFSGSDYIDQLYCKVTQCETHKQLNQKPLSGNNEKASLRHKKWSSIRYATFLQGLIHQ